MSEEALRAKAVAISIRNCANAKCQAGCVNAFAGMPCNGCQSKLMREAAEIIESLQRNTLERLTPKLCRKEIATEPTKSVNGGIFGKGTTLWFCPECGIFNTPAHKFCWACGQALAYDLPGKEKKVSVESVVRSEACQRCEEIDKCLWDLDAICHCSKPRNANNNDSPRAEGDVQSENQ